MALTKVKTGQIGTDVIVAEDIAANAITVSELQDNAVTAAKLSVSGNGTSGQALTSDGDGTFSWTTITSDLVDDASPQLGAALDTNGNNITFGDSSSSSVNRLNLGVSNDLQIYHDGTDSVIKDTGTGNLVLTSNGGGIFFRNDAETETYANFNNNGAVELRYDNSQKFITTSTGIDVTGTVTADGITLEDNQNIIVGTGGDLYIYHNGSNSHIEDRGTGDLVLKANNDFWVQDYGTNEAMIRASSNGAVSLYYDNSVKLATTSSGITVTGTVTADGFASGDGEYAYFGASQDLKIGHDGSNSIIADLGTGSLILQDSVGNNMAVFTSGGDAELYWDGSKKLETTSSGVSITGDLSVSGSVSGAGTGNYEEIYSADSSSVSSVDINNVPSWASKIVIAFENFGPNSSAYVYLRLKNSSGSISSGYENWIKRFGGGSLGTESKQTGQFMLQHQQPDGLGGIFILQKTNGGWGFAGNSVDLSNDTSVTTMGSLANTSTITGLQIYTSTGNFITGGSLSVTCQGEA